MNVIDQYDGILGPNYDLVERPELGALLMFLRRYEPVKSEDFNSVTDALLSSKEIHNLLEQVSTISINDVTGIMTILGFELEFRECLSPSWILRAK